jgi:hypothetical protein
MGQIGPIQDLYQAPPIQTDLELPEECESQDVRRMMNILRHYPTIVQIQLSKIEEVHGLDINRIVTRERSQCDVIQAGKCVESGGLIQIRFDWKVVGIASLISLIVGGSVGWKLAR